ncbi:MAG: flippase [Candidatus Falkowbacteria bacterium]
MEKLFTIIKKFVPAKWHWVLSHNGFKKYLANTGWLFFSRVFVMFLAFFVSAYVARYLGPEKYGTLNYIISLVGLFSFIPNLGINSLLSRELIKYPNERDDLMGTAFILQIFGGLLGIFCLGFFVIFLLHENAANNFLLILVASTFILQALNVVDVYFQSNVMAKKVVIIQMLSFSLSSLLKIVFIFLNLPLAYFVALYVVDAVFFALGLIFIYKKNGLSFLKWRFKYNLAKELLKESWPLMLSSSFLLIYGRIDQVMIKQMMNDYSLGLYAISAKLSEAWLFIPTAIIGSLFPAIVNAKKDNKDSYENRLKKIYSLTFYLSFFISLFIFIFARLIINILFGSAFLPAVLSLQIYVWSGVATAMGFAVSQYLIIEGKTKILFIINFLSMAANVLLNLWLIPRMGISGAALATLISYSLMVFGLIFFKNVRWQLRLMYQSLFLK